MLFLIYFTYILNNFIKRIHFKNAWWQFSVTHYSWTVQKLSIFWRRNTSSNLGKEHLEPVVTRIGTPTNTTANYRTALKHIMKHRTIRERRRRRKQGQKRQKQNETGTGPDDNPEQVKVRYRSRTSQGEGRGSLGERTNHHDGVRIASGIDYLQ